MRHKSSVCSARRARWCTFLLALWCQHHVATGFRVFQTLADFQKATRAVFQPYQKGFVGYYGDPTNPDPERVNEGSPFSPDTPRIFYTESPKQNCPGMVGPFNQTEYFCTGREYGYCDRRFGLCVCNIGYQGADCSVCEPSYFKIGSLCYPKLQCPNDCSRGGICDYKTGSCTCFSHRKGTDCSQVYCSFDKLCESCTSTQCLKCADGYFVTAAQTCSSCTIHDPRCVVCNQTSCLECADPLLNSVRRSGARKIDAQLPLEESTREFSFKFSYGSQSPRVFDEAEPFFLVPSASSTNPLNQNTKACMQGLNQDASWSCSSVASSHVVCGHYGTITFDSPVYAVSESSRSVYLTVKRTGGGVGTVSVDYELNHRTTTDQDVSAFMFYKSYQPLVFGPGVVQLSFEIPIYDDRVYEIDKQFEIVLKNPTNGATIGNQKVALVTILDDDGSRLDASQSFVINADKTLLAGGTAGVTSQFQIQAVNSLGKTMSSGGDNFVVEIKSSSQTILDQDGGLAFWNESSVVYGTVTDLANGVYVVTWSRQTAGLYDVSVWSIVAGGLRGDYYDDPWFDAPRRVTRIDRQVYFTWGTGYVFDGAQDFLAIRWSGFLNPKASGSCTLYVEADDQFRLFVDHDLVLDYWTLNDSGGGETQVQLVTTKFYEIVLEYRDLRGEAHVKLFWSSPSFAKEIIPASYLYSKTLVTGQPFRSVRVLPNTVDTSGTLVEGKLATLAGVPLAFIIHSGDAYGNMRENVGVKDVITATATLVTDTSLGGTGNRVVDADIVYNGLHRRFDAILVPQVSGTYDLNVYVYPSGNPVKTRDSPVSVSVAPNVMHATQSVITGPGISNSRTAGVLTYVTVTARDAFSNRILVGGSKNQLLLRAVHTTATNNAIEMGYVMDNGDGTYRIDYTPRIVGNYKVYVYLNDTTVNDSPYLVSVVTNIPCGATSVASGSGISTASTFVQTSFVVTTKDAQANLIQSGGTIISWSLQAPAPNGNIITGTCNDLLNGQYSCPYTAQVVGLNSLSVFINQNSVEPIQSSPFQVQVVAGPAFGSSSFATGSGLVSSIVGVPTLFSVFIRDHYANDKVNAGSEVVQVSITHTTVGISDSQTGTVKYLANGEYQVSYIVYKTGLHSMAVSVDGVAINSSPFTFMAHPNVASYTTTSLDLAAGASSLYVAGQPMATTITSRDIYGNVLESGGYSFSFDEQIASITNVVDTNNGIYQVTISPTRAQLHQAVPQLLIPGGLNASYFANDAFFGAVKLQRVEPSVDFDLEARNPTALEAQSSFSVVWKGFLKPLYSEIYTFDVALQGGMTLQLNKETVLNAWNGIADPRAITKGQKLLEANTFVPIEVRFRKNESLHQFAKLQVFWKSLSQPRQKLPSTALFTQWRIVNTVSPLTVAPAQAFGPAFTSANQQGVAGNSLTFDVIARDRYGNQRPLSQAEQRDFKVFVVFPQIPVDRAPPVQISYVGNGIFRCSLVPLMAGNFSMVLAATDQRVYEETGQLDGYGGLLTRLDPYLLTGSPYWMAIQPNDPVASASTAFGEGFELGIAGAKTVFYVQTRDASGNRVTSGLTRVAVELRTTVTTITGSTRQVVVAASAKHVDHGKYEITYVAEIAGGYEVFLSINGNPFVSKGINNNNINVKRMLQIQANVSSALTSTTSGEGTNSRLLIGMAHAYEVQVRDLYGNLMGRGGNNLYVVAQGPCAAAASRCVAGDSVDLQNGKYVVSFQLPVEGVYELQTHLVSEQHGLTGLYFDNERFVASSAASKSQIDPQINFVWAAAGAGERLNVRQYLRIRWKGFVKPRFTEKYVLSVQMIGNSALFIDDQVVFDTLNSMNQGESDAVTKSASGELLLVGDRMYRITVEYRNPWSHVGQLVLFWQSDRQAKEPVPSERLFPQAQEIQPRYTILATTTL